MPLFLLIFCLFSFCSGTEPLSFEAITHELVTYTQAVQHSPRNDLRVWTDLAQPLCTLFTSYQTEDAYRLLFSYEQLRKAADFLISYGETTDSLPPSIQQACSALSDHLHMGRKGMHQEHRSFSARAITEQVKRSVSQNEHRRLTSDEYKRQQRILHENNRKQRDERRHMRHVEKQVSRHQHHAKIDTHRESNRHAQESRTLREKKKRTIEKEASAQLHRTSLAQSQSEQAQLQEARRKAAQEALLNSF